MKTKVEVADRKEAKLIKGGLADPATRAIVKIIGSLADVGSEEHKRRILRAASCVVRELNV